MNKKRDDLVNIFNKEQGTFSYYTCGLLVAIIGYSFKLVLESNKCYIEISNTIFIYS